jgi:hypothetical protein
MSFITATAAFAQYRRCYDAVTTTANSTYSGAVTNTALLAVAGPDGSLVTRISSIPRATVTATQMQLYRSKDGGTTFQFFTTALMAAYTMLQTTACTPTNFNNMDGTTLSETNPIPLTGMTDFDDTTTDAGTSGGSANAQTLPFANVSALTQYSVFDFEAGLTNTAGTTLQFGTTAATSVVRDISGAALSAGDITAGFRYRVWYDGSNFRLIITDRLYVAQGVTLAGGIVTTAQIADF